MQKKKIFFFLSSSEDEILELIVFDPDPYLSSYFVRFDFVPEKTMLVFFDIDFIRRDQNERRNGEACRASPTCFWSSLINLISKHTYVSFYLSCIIIRFNGEKKNSERNEKQTQFCSNLLTSRMPQLGRHSTNKEIVTTVNISSSPSSS